MKLSLATCLFLTLLAAVICLGNGCATDDPENISARPWNSPNNNGDESGMLQNLDNQHR